MKPAEVVVERLDRFFQEFRKLGRVDLAQSMDLHDHRLPWHLVVGHPDPLVVSVDF